LLVTTVVQSSSQAPQEEDVDSPDTEEDEEEPQEEDDGDQATVEDEEGSATVEWASEGEHEEDEEASALRGRRVGGDARECGC